MARTTNVQLGTETVAETITPSRLRYSPTRALGRGSFGDVYQGTLDEGSSVAVKVLRTGNAVAARQFRRELRRYTQLRGVTGVVHFYGASQTCDSNVDVLVTELMQGGSLRNTIDQGGMDARSALVIAEMVANSLAAIHKRGFSHGDVSASNVLLSRPLNDADMDQGLNMPLPSDPGPEPVRAKLVDFGLSRDIRRNRLSSPTSEDEDDAPNMLAYTQSGSAPPIEPLGTPAYLAPEAWRGRTALRDSKVALAADVYALGILLYELECGLQPWAGMTEWAIFGAVYHAEKRPPWPESHEGSFPALREIVHKCWKQKYEERPSARQVALEIRALRRAVGIATPPGSGVSSPEVPENRTVDEALQAMRLLGERSDSDSDPGKKMMLESNGGSEALLDTSNSAVFIGGLVQQGTSNLHNHVFSKPSSDDLNKHLPLKKSNQVSTSVENNNEMELLREKRPVRNVVEGAKQSPFQMQQHVDNDVLPPSSQTEQHTVGRADNSIHELHQTLPSGLNNQLDATIVHEQSVYHVPRKETPSDMERAQNVILQSVVPESHSPPLRIPQQQQQEPPSQTSELQEQPPSQPQQQPSAPSSPGGDQGGVLARSSSGHSNLSQSSVPSSAFRRARKKTPANMRFVGNPRDVTEMTRAAADIDLMQPLSPLRVPTAPPQSKTIPMLKPLSQTTRQSSLPSGAQRGAMEEEDVPQPMSFKLQMVDNQRIVQQNLLRPEEMERLAAAKQVQPPPSLEQVNEIVEGERQPTSFKNQQLSTNSPVVQKNIIDVQPSTLPERTKSQVELEKDEKYEAQMREEMKRAEELRKLQSQHLQHAQMKQQRQASISHHMQTGQVQPTKQQIRNQLVDGMPLQIRHPVLEDDPQQVGHSRAEVGRQHVRETDQQHVEMDQQETDQTPVNNVEEAEGTPLEPTPSRESLEKNYPFKAEVHNNDVNAVIFALDCAQQAVDAAHALRALAVLCGIDDGNRVLAVRGHALEVAAVALARHGRSHPAACRAMCELVLQLARAHNTEVERELRNTAACEHVLNALRWHPTSRGVQQAAAMALAALCRSSGALAAIVVAQNGAHAATRALARATNARDKPDGPAAVGALDAIAALSAAHAENVVRARVLTDVVGAVRRLASPAIDAAAAGVIHACARSDAGRKAMLEDGAIIAALAMLMTRARAAPDAARILALGCDAFAELAYAGGPAAADALTGGPVLESVLMSLNIVDGAQPFHAGTVLAVRALVCLRRFAELGIDTCAELHAAHALQAAIDVVNARPENQDVAIGAAQFVAVIVGRLAKGPTRGGVLGAEAALEMLRGLDETWLLDLRVLEVVRGAINIVENALGGRISRLQPSDNTVKMATARPGPRRLFRRKKRK